MERWRELNRANWDERVAVHRAIGSHRASAWGYLPILDASSV